MNSKKANWAFLITIAVYLGIIVFVALFFPALAESLVLNNLICETVLLLPILVFILASKEEIRIFSLFTK